MNRNLVGALIGTMLLAAEVQAQWPAISAEVTQAVVVSAGAATNSVPIGPLPANVLNVSSAVPSSSASLQALPLGNNGYELHAVASAVVGMQGPLTIYDIAGEITLTLTLPVTTQVLVVLDGVASMTGTGLGATSTEVDIADDGSVDFTISPTSPAVGIEFGMLVGPSGSKIRLRHRTAQAISFLTGAADHHVSITAFPVNAPLTRYGAGCMPLTWTRSSSGAATLSCPAATGTLALFAIGTNPILQPLPFSANCFLLTAIDIVVAGTPVGGSATLPLGNVTPPAGGIYTMQAVVLGPNLMLMSIATGSTTAPTKTKHWCCSTVVLTRTAGSPCEVRAAAIWRCCCLVRTT
jgi:hypothetical protein